MPDSVVSLLGTFNIYLLYDSAVVACLFGRPLPIVFHFDILTILFGPCWFDAITLGLFGDDGEEIVDVDADEMAEDIEEEVVTTIAEADGDASLLLPQQQQQQHVNRKSKYAVVKDGGVIQINS